MWLIFIRPIVTITVQRLMTTIMTTTIITSRFFHSRRGLPCFVLRRFALTPLNINSFWGVSRPSRRQVSAGPGFNEESTPRIRLVKILLLSFPLF